MCGTSQYCRRHLCSVRCRANWCMLQLTDSAGQVYSWLGLAWHRKSKREEEGRRDQRWELIWKRQTKEGIESERQAPTHSWLIIEWYTGIITHYSYYQSLLFALKSAKELIPTSPNKTKQLATFLHLDTCREFFMQAQMTFMIMCTIIINWWHIYISNSQFSSTESTPV